VHEPGNHREPKTAAEKNKLKFDQILIGIIRTKEQRDFGIIKTKEQRDFSIDTKRNSMTIIEVTFLPPSFHYKSTKIESLAHYS
jgi:hypothetical protein